MKVQIKNLEPNPYRDINNYPIDEAKVQSLVDSINQTGFWDNILARKHDGKVQIAYGHHRREALQRAMKPTDEVDIPVKLLSDAMMIKIMARENDESWETNPTVTNETVRVARDYLEQHPDDSPEPEKINYSKEAAKIADFLGWNEHRVYASLLAIRGFETGELNKPAAESMPHDDAQEIFTGSIRTAAKVSGRPITLTQQRRAAERIVRNQDFSRIGIRAAVVEEINSGKKKPVPEFKLLELKAVVGETAGLLRKVNTNLDRISRFRDVLGDDLYEKGISELGAEIRRLLGILKNFKKGDTHVKQITG